MWNHGRSSRGRRGRGEPVSVSRQHQAVSTLRSFLDDLVFWQWPARPARSLVHVTDLPKLLQHVPRALTPTDDFALMAAVGQLEDVAGAAPSASFEARAGVSASCLGSSSTACSTSLVAGAGCVCSSASSPPSARCRSTRRRSPPSTSGWRIADASVPYLIRGLANRPTCSS